MSISKQIVIFVILVRVLIDILKFVFNQNKKNFENALCGMISGTAIIIIAKIVM